MQIESTAIKKMTGVSTMPIVSRLRLLIAQKEVSERRRISLRQLSEETSIPLNTLKRIHANRQEQHQIDVLYKLADYFDCTLDDLFERDEGEGEAFNDRSMVAAAA